jgi:hypothetical protein
MWHLMSLDAPTVATVWAWFVAHCERVALPAEIYAAMFVAVWLLYATDRLLDWPAGNSEGYAELEARHRFHHRHRDAFTKAIAAGCLVLAALLVRIPEMLFLAYCGLGGLLLMWFATIHGFAPKRSERLPKELAVGLFFPAAIFVPGWLDVRGERDWLTLAAICFGLLCTLNCLSIYAWEHAADEVAGAHITTRWGVRALRPLGAITIGASLAAAIFAPQHLAPIFLAMACAAGLLWVLDRIRNEMERTGLRAAADLVLLTPLLIAPFVR